MRRLRSLTALALLAAGTAVALPSPAQAAPLDMTCTPPSSNVSTYSPALTSTPQTVTSTITALWGPCTSASQPAITSGYRSATVPFTGSCLELLQPATLTTTITWNTGQTSTVTTNYLGAIAGAVFTVTSTGTVTGGLFAGDSVVINLTGPSADIALCTAGLGTVSSIYMLGTLVIS
ncbi:MAG: hypothetical protein HOV78_13895 [Hamadaea sp.]|nr:hypothetical protein [Hamadaea sp.]NUT06384.1 hypothetical protein [Hamadaea sp.]